MKTLRLAFATLVALIAATAVAAAELVGYRAEYRLVAPYAPPDTRVDGSSQVSLVPSCSGWDYQQRFSIVVQSELENDNFVQSITGKESRDGLRAEYAVDSALNGRHALGQLSVAFPAKGQPGKLTFVQSGRTSTKDAPSGLLLFASGAQSMLERLQAGERNFTMSVVAPQSPGGVELMRVEVLSRSPFGGRLPADIQSALPARSWFVRLTRSDGSNSQTAIQELYENGVVTRILSRQGDLELQITVQRLTIMAKPAC